MVKIDLITGFLGAGKTSFIKEYVKHLMDKGENVCILENDFGAVNVDMMLLQDIMSDNCDLEMVAGGCDYDCHKRRFKTKLIAMGMSGFDRVIVEPSGIYDVDEFFDVLCEEPLDRWYKINNVIALVDANLEIDNMSKEANYILASQVANAGQVVLTKADRSDEKTNKATVSYINKVLEEVGCDKKIDYQQIEKKNGSLSTNQLENILNCGYLMQKYNKLWFEQNEAFNTLYYMDIRMKTTKLKETIKNIMEDKSCGNIFRIKGFMLTEDDTWIEVNATKQSTAIESINKGQEVFIIIGENLDKNEIDKKILN